MAHKPRTVHVLCAKPSGYRWLKAHLNGCAIETPDGFQVLNESMWAARLQAAEGKEVE